MSKKQAAKFEKFPAAYDAITTRWAKEGFAISLGPPLCIVPAGGWFSGPIRSLGISYGNRIKRLKLVVTTKARYLTVSEN